MESRSSLHREGVGIIRLRRRHPFVNRAHHRARRPSTHVLDQLSDRVVAASGGDFNTPVREIAHPSRHGEAPGALAHEPAEPDALDASRYLEMDGPHVPMVLVATPEQSRQERGKHRGIAPFGGTVRDDNLARADALRHGFEPASERVRRLGR